MPNIVVGMLEQLPISEPLHIEWMVRLLKHFMQIRLATKSTKKILWKRRRVTYRRLVVDDRIVQLVLHNMRLLLASLPIRLWMHMASESDMER